MGKRHEEVFVPSVFREGSPFAGALCSAGIFLGGRIFSEGIDSLNGICRGQGELCQACELGQFPSPLPTEPAPGRADGEWGRDA